MMSKYYENVMDLICFLRAVFLLTGTRTKNEKSVQLTSGASLKPQQKLFKLKSQRKHNK